MLKFTKMTGAGNDFVLIDNRQSMYEYDWSKLAPKICDRRFGVGADGLLILLPSSTADFTMQYFNADGSYGGMCGNGGRCAAQFVMAESNLQSTTFDALDHIYHAKSTNGNNIRLLMKNVSELQTNIKLTIFGLEVILHFVDTGSPHVILFVDQLPSSFTAEINSSGITRIGREIRNNENFKPGGTNVNFVQIVNTSTIGMRTYERGVEDETLACGTGAIASAIVSATLRAIAQPVKVITRSNNILEVSFQKENSIFTSVSLQGPAKLVFEGSFSPNVA